MRFFNILGKSFFPVVLTFVMLGNNAKGQTLEVGVFGGGAYMLNDSVRAIPFKNGGFTVGVLGRYNINTRWAARFSYNFASINYNRMGRSDTVYNTPVHDITLVGEFNFLDYATGSKYNNFSPYIFGGISGFTCKNDISAAFTFGLGIKYSLTKKIGVGVEWGMRKTFTDTMDGSDFDGSFMYGSDWYNFTGVTITYKLDIFNQNRCSELTW